MKYVYKRARLRLRLALLPCLAAFLVGLVGVLWIFVEQGTSGADEAAGTRPAGNVIRVTGLEANCYDSLARIRGWLPASWWSRAAGFRYEPLIVGITDQDPALLDPDAQYRVHRQYLAEGFRRLANAEPKLVFFDCLLPSASGSTSEWALVEQMRILSNRLVLASGMGIKGAPAPLYLTNATFGSANVDAEPGKTVRLLPGVFGPSRKDTSAAWVAATKLGSKVVRTGSPSAERWLNYYGPQLQLDSFGKAHRTFEFMDFSQLLRTNVDGLPGLCRDRLVFIGDGRGGDTFRNPVDGRSMLGVEVLATAVLNLDNGTWLRMVPAGWQIVLIACWGLFLGCFLSWKRSLARTVTVLVLTLGLILVSVLGLQLRFWWWWLIPVLQTAGAILICNWRLGCIAFISYRSSDGERLAALLEECIEARGRRAFMAPGEIKPGEQFSPRLFLQIRRAPVFFLVATVDAVEELKRVGSWINREAAEALLRQRLIFVVRSKEVRPLKEEDLPANVKELASFESRVLETGIGRKAIYEEICPF